LSHQALTRIYGAEDWDQVQQNRESQEDEVLFSNIKVLELS
jgi:hypothetical protein